MWIDVFLGYVCPSLGVVMSAAMYAAPVNDLRVALLEGKIGSLNPVPWAVMTGNCLGWIVYAYYSADPFILASNIPGLLVSVWLNMGAAKLQYSELRQLDNDLVAEDETEDATSSRRNSNFVFVSQETLLLRILSLWVVILVCVGWLGLAKGHEMNTVGVLVNINLIFFYGAPLQTMKTVIAEKSSESIHVPTMVMNWFNTSFWMLYGLAKMDPIIYLPNGLGLFLGITQGVISCIYPRRSDPDVNMQPLLQESQEEDDFEDPTGEIA